MNETPSETAGADSLSDATARSDLSDVVIYTDGACRGNPGPGGWGALLLSGPHEKTLCGHERRTTNNRMELMAAIMALRELKRPCRVALWTDSEYLRRGITEWIHGWVKRGWKTASRQPVKNAELWQALLAESQRHTIEWRWVKGHSGHPGNERADALANQAIDEASQSREALHASDRSRH